MAEAVDFVQAEEVREPSLLESCLGDRRLSLALVIALTLSILSIALALLHLFVAEYGIPDSRAFRSTHLTVMLVLAYMYKPLGRASQQDPVLVPGDPGNRRRALGFAADLVLVALVLMVQVYTLYDVDAFKGREGELSEWDVYMGSLFILLVLEATRRAVGWTMVILAVFFIVHSLYAPYFFGIFYGPPTNYERYIDVIFLRTEGIFGIPIYVASTYIVLFILFGAILIRSGAGRFFIDLAIALTGHRTGGPAKAAVVASAFMGTVSGSAVANVVTTGSFTIPMMKRLGYRPKFAAAVEACASSGGQITPPIMGAAAFIMAEFLEVSYLWIIVAAIVPAFLYFATVYFMVHLEAEKQAITRIDKDRLPPFLKVLARGWHLLLSLILLVAILIAGFTPMKAAFWAILALVALSFVNKATRMSAVDIFAALETGVKSALPVSIACACAGIIIGSMFASGVGLKFTNSVIDLSGGNLMVLLALTALAAIVLGMGMTTTAVYITVAALIVPSLIEIGVVPIAAHLFAFYYGVVSAITPPVALAAFAAAALAQTPPMATAVESARIGIAKYLVPFVFVYNPSLLLEGPLWLTAYSTVTALAGLGLLSAALEGWLKGPLPPLLRLAIAVAAVGLLYPPGLGAFGLPGYVLNAAAAVAGVLIWLARGRPAPEREGTGSGARP
ncbi:MAG: TRAP transporter permease [Proteobacteria bacterium]|nr:TRAP transporter permease [Pseudomonadota bacterium]MCH8139786.1 TRAP transporter permease [Pseudomonadota bacterium]